ncbi:MAG: signal recognition particle receptor subunit alpha, partial [Candidatus Krumholzibacteriota bacterium]|nr:signal recognition particle receptor subunit alpha [Candidatus Krumholzibacteriota bacterium]
MNRIVKGLRKTKERLINPLRKIFTSSLLDENVVEEIEELLLSADMGVEATERVIERIRERMRTPGDPVQGYLELVADELRKVIDEVPAYQPPAGNPRVIVLVGVNGVGKTSTIGKLAYRFREEGRKVLVAAGDT